MASAFCGRLGELAEDAGQGGVVEDVDHSQGGAILTLNSLGTSGITSKPANEGHFKTGQRV